MNQSRPTFSEPAAFSGPAQRGAAKWPGMTELPTLRRELLALLADTDTDMEEIREKIEVIVGEIERLAGTADDSRQTAD